MHVCMYNYLLSVKNISNIYIHIQVVLYLYNIHLYDTVRSLSKLTLKITDKQT